GRTRAAACSCFDLNGTGVCLFRRKEMNVSAISDLPSLSQMRAGQLNESGISLVIPVHNAAMTLTATLRSVIQQSYAEWEAIIVDDGSTDRTRAIATDFAQRDPRF